MNAPDGYWTGVRCMFLSALMFFQVLGLDVVAQEVLRDSTLPAISQRPTHALEDRLSSLEAELNDLAGYSLRSGVGSIGYRSDAHSEANSPESIRIDFARSFLVDAVVVVPNLLRDAVGGFRAEGFPLVWRVVLGDEKGNETVVASFSSRDAQLPRVAPVFIRFKPAQAKWLRIEAEQLTSRQYDSQYIFQVAEVMVFSGAKNVALHASVSSSSDDSGGSRAYAEQFAVDGFTPYLMNGSAGEESLAYVVLHKPSEDASIVFDLESPVELSSVHLHLVDQSDTVPQTFSGDFGFPLELQIEGANNEDFSDAHVLARYSRSGIYETGPIVSMQCDPVSCRYVRINPVQPDIAVRDEGLVGRLGFAEVQLIAEGRNVVLGRRPRSALVPSLPRTVAALTDGNNFYGRVLPIRRWMHELALRHELESERPLIQAELSRRYQRQARNLRFLTWVAVALALGVVLAVAVGWSLRRRAILRTRERIAADLHDELGANVHALGLLSDLAQDATNDPERMSSLMQRMRDLTQRTGKAANYCVNLLESKEMFDDLETEIRRASSRILADFDHDLTIEGNEVLSSLDTKTQIDLFLFYKECITNVLRHADASRVTTCIRATPRLIELQVSDDGIGMQEEVVPRSLRRRAKFLSARVSLEQNGMDGTSIALEMKLGNPVFG